MIDLAIKEGNDAFANSGVNMELNLVHAAKTDYIETEENPTHNALHHLQNPTDGYMDEVHELRTQYGAGELPKSRSLFHEALINHLRSLSILFSLHLL